MITEVGIAKASAAIFMVVGATLIEVPAWGSISLIEALWTATGLGMIVLSLWALPRVVEDWIITRRVPGHYSEARTLLARGHIRREAIRLVQGAIVTAVGLYASLVPGVTDPVVVTPATLVLTAGLLSLGALSGLQTILDRRVRNAAEALIDHDDS